MPSSGARLVIIPFTRIVRTQTLQGTFHNFRVHLPILTAGFAKATACRRPVTFAVVNHSNRHPGVVGSGYREDAFEANERQCRTCDARDA